MLGTRTGRRSGPAARGRIPFIPSLVVRRGFIRFEKKNKQQATRKLQKAAVRNKKAGTYFYVHIVLCVSPSFRSFLCVQKMYIKSMVVDGFKSYGQRTEINGFDPMFNAITGLNGSGKSNILDAICFLLGITNLSHVRATNLQELVYKSGQAGVTKATVTVTFDNKDKKQSPIGYEHYDEVTVTRQVCIACERILSLLSHIFVFAF